MRWMPRVTNPQYRRSSFLPSVAVVAAILWASADILSQETPGQLPFAVELVDGRPAAAGEALVAFRTAGGAAELRAQGLDVTTSGLGIRRVTAEGMTTEALVASLRGRPDVAFAEPNFVAHLDDPNDPFFPSLWGLWNREVPGADINALAAWRVSTGTKAYAVAVLDTGIDYYHRDLAPNIWSAPAPYTVTVRGVRVTCPQGSHGFNAIELTCDPMDDHGHGTRMAGVIGAVGNNDYGVAGVNWNASLIAVKFLGADGFGTYDDAIAGLDYLLQLRTLFPAAADVRVVSNSWGGGGFSDALLAQIERTAAAGMLFVAAAGNDGANNDLAPHYPSNFDVPSIVAVTATTEYDTRAEHASFGARSVDVGAPGPQNFSTGRAGAFQRTGGTSTATAFVSGAAALLLARCGLHATALKATLLGTVDPVPDLTGFTVTGGRINVGRAMERCAAANAAPSVRMTLPSAGSYYSAPATITVGADATDAGGRVARVDFYAQTFDRSVFIGSDTTAPYRATWTAAIGGSILHAVAVDDRGATARSAPLRIQVTPTPVAPPAPWATADIGATGLAGTTWVMPHFEKAKGYAAVLEGAGLDVWGTSDDFRFVYQPLTGDGEITALVDDIEHINAWTKAGVMIRESLAPASRHAFMLVSAGKGLAFQRRRATGALSVHTAAGSGSAPAWVRLVRRGSTITAFKSRDGLSWTTVGTDRITMGTTVYVGLAVVSRDRSRLATAVFDSVRVRAIAAGPPSGPAPQSASLSLRFTDVGDVGESGGYDTSADPSCYRVYGAGADVWGTADAFGFAYQRLTGDGRIVARVASMDAVHAWTKVGVMMRASLDPRSPHAFMMVTPGKGLAFQRRLTAGALSLHTSGGAGSAPRWVQLARVGQVITASVSSDAVTWTTVGRSTIPMPDQIWVGLAVSSHDATRIASAAFTDVNIYD